MIRRPRRTVAATLVAAVLLAGAVVIAISCIQVITGQAPLLPFDELTERARASAWNDPAVLALGAVAVLVGVLLVAAAVLPGTPRVLPLAGGNGHTDAGVARTGLARDLTAHARRTDGVTTAAVSVAARRVTVVARTPLRDRSGLADRVRDAVTARLDDVDLARRPRVRVTIATDRRAR